MDDRLKQRADERRSLKNVTSSTTEMTIKRSDVEIVTLRLSHLPESLEYFRDHVTHWWTHELVTSSQQLQLISGENNADRRDREEKAFRRLIAAWAANGHKMPKVHEITFDDVAAPDENSSEQHRRFSSRQPLPDDPSYPQGILHARRLVSELVNSLDQDLVNTETGIRVASKQPQTLTSMELRGRDEEEPPNHAALRAEARKFGPVEEDVTDILLANARETDPDENGHYLIYIDKIISYRGDHGRKRRRDTGKPSDIYTTTLQAIESAFARLEAIWILENGSYDLDGQEVADHTRAFTVVVAIKATDSDQYLHAIKYKLSPRLFDRRALVTYAPTVVLEFDARSRDLKALARYFTQRADQVDSTTRQLSRRIRDVFHEINGLTQSEAVNNPARVRTKLEEKLKRLCDERILVQWFYKQSIKDIPPRSWLNIWLDMEIVVEFPESAFRPQFAHDRHSGPRSPMRASRVDRRS